MLNLTKKKIGVIGLGYVGLPIAVSFAKYFNVVGFDKNEKRINELIEGNDRTQELTHEELKNIKSIKFSFKQESIKDCDIYIITVPTPINKNKLPDLSFLKKATKLIGNYLSKDNIVIFESTVYPGVTEEICVPILEKNSGFKLNEEFFVSYSPERINPGDKNHKISDITKVVSASNKKTLVLVKNLYSKIVKAGIYCAENIRTAEAAKIIENIQRDVNIALINEFSIIFKKLNINTYKVLEAAKTKWNFLDFTPGLVGGHCIGVDPYYLTYKSKKIGYNPKLILSGRSINEKMFINVATNFIEAITSKFDKIKNFNVLILGVTFKENCPDIRNSKVLDLIQFLKFKKININFFDPLVGNDILKHENQISNLKSIPKDFYHGIVLAVPHNEFLKLGIKKIEKFGLNGCIIFDMKNMFRHSRIDLTL